MVSLMDLMRTLTGEVSSRGMCSPVQETFQQVSARHTRLRRLLQLPPFDYLTRDIDKRPVKAVSWEICVMRNSCALRIQFELSDLSYHDGLAVN
jgi:hypothetical protein